MNIITFRVSLVTDDMGQPTDLWEWFAGNCESKDIVSYSSHWTKESAVYDAEQFIAFVLDGCKIKIVKEWEERK